MDGKVNQVGQGGMRVTGSEDGQVLRGRSVDRRVNVVAERGRSVGGI